jgi:hypothetical protein
LWLIGAGLNFVEGRFVLSQSAMACWATLENWQSNVNGCDVPTKLDERAGIEISRNYV